MSLVVSPATNLVLGPAYTVGPYGDDNPVVGYDNRITRSNITADISDPDYPASNLGNVSTAEIWRSTDTYDQALEAVFSGTAEMDYLAFAKHNFATAGIDIAVDVATELDIDSMPVWFEVVPSTAVATDGPVLVRFTAGDYIAIRLRMSAGDEAPEIGVLYAGKALVLERTIQVGHTPITYGRDTNIVNQVSENGNFLGRIKVGETLETAFDMQIVTPGSYRSDIDPWVEAATTKPFFFAWRPETWPNEVGFCWMTNQPRPVNAFPNGGMSIDFQMRGVT